MKRLVLVGAGHAHALVLNAWRNAKQPSVELTLVTPMTHAPYSGMIPGWLAGQYQFDETVVDFAGLCERAGANVIQAELTRLNPDTNTIELSNGQTVSYDWLSLNVGSTLVPPASQTPILAMRPLSTLKTRYEAWLANWQASADSSPLRLTAVGGGAAGVESLLCIRHRLAQLRPDKPIQARLITRGTTILPGFSHAARRLALTALHHAHVTVQPNTDWCETIAQSSDLMIWATGAQAHAWQTDPDRRGNLQTDGAGFVVVDEQLRSVSHTNVFAVGDCAALSSPVPKAGVYAVRMGPTLTANLLAVIQHKPLVPFTRHGSALALLNMANNSAIASWGPLGWQGKWVMHWKDRIDRGFIERLTCST
jgi:pyridine nucleotide-disulfide oxidoreductase family protein